LRHADFERSRDHFQITNADFLLPVLQVGDEAAIDADVLGHVDLCPALFLSQALKGLPESDADIAGHASMMAVGFRR
jgi:hypothetical protein